MIRLFIASLLAIVAFSGTPALASVQVGQPAPDFTGTDHTGKQVKLSDFKGKLVVLEWNNPGCPFVVKHYDTHNMQMLQKDATAKDVVWLTINSSAAGKQGNMTGEEAGKYYAEKGLASSHYILDPTGEIGLLYEAKTTPHMYIVNKDGVLAYAGAIDDKATANHQDVQGAHNYVSAALAELMEGKAVTHASTQAYGCSVKYDN